MAGGGGDTNGLDQLGILLAVLLEEQRCDARRCYGLLDGYACSSGRRNGRGGLRAVTDYHNLQRYYNNKAQLLSGNKQTSGVLFIISIQTREGNPSIHFHVIRDVWFRAHHTHTDRLAPTTAHS